MEFENFKKAVECAETLDNFFNELNNIGIKIYNTEAFDSIFTLENMLFEESFGERGLFLVEDYLLHESIKKEDGSEKHIENIEELWELINKKE